MIKTYTASPVFIHDIDMNKAGSGQDIARHGKGMYFGSLETAEHYLNDYRHYSVAEHHITHCDVTLPEGSEGHRVASLLIEHDMNKEAVAELLEGHVGELEMLDILHDGRTPTFEHQRGVLYEVELRGIDIDEVRHWDQRVSNDTLTEIAERHYEKTVTLPTAIDIFDEHIELDGFSFAEASETLFEEAINHAINEGELYNYDEGDMRALWDARMRGDHHYSNQHETEFELLDPAFLDALEAITKSELDLHYEATWGDVYQHFTHILNERGEQDGPAAAARFFANTLRVPMLQGEAVFGGHKAQEYVVFCETTLNDAAFSPLSPSERRERESFPLPSNDNEPDFINDDLPSIRPRR